jgi:hypothetical protein
MGACNYIGTDFITLVNTISVTSEGFRRTLIYIYIYIYIYICMSVPSLLHRRSIIANVAAHNSVGLRIHHHVINRRNIVLIVGRATDMISKRV